MKYKINLFTALTLGISFLSSQVNASEFDQYLQQQQIIDSKFKIKKKAELNEMLAVLSAEDSKTLPLQIDHNTIIERLKLTANKTERLYKKGEIIFREGGFPSGIFLIKEGLMVSPSSTELKALGVGSSAVPV